MHASRERRHRDDETTLWALAWWHTLAPIQSAMPLTSRGRKATARTDSDITDDEAGKARIEAAAQSKARKAAEEAERKRQNADMREKLKKGPARTDDNIDDDEAGRARQEFAAASKARLDKEREERQQHKLEMEKRIKNTGARTDNMMDTEVAAIARKTLAEKSRAQKQAQDALRRRQNAELMRKVKEVQPKADFSIDDEAAGVRRAELAAESARRRTAQREQEKKWFAHLQSRVELAQGPEPIEDEATKRFRETQEKHELHDARASTVSHATWVAYQNYVDKHSVAEAARRDRNTREERRQAQRRAWAEHGKDLSMQRAQQMETIREVHTQMARENQEMSQQLRLEEAIWQRRKDRIEAKYMEKVKARVKTARGLDDKLDAQEGAQDALERHQGSQMMEQIMSELKEVREGGLAVRRENTKCLKELTRQGVRDAKDNLLQDNAFDVAMKREESRILNERKQEWEEEYLETARANKREAERTRARIRASSKAMKRRNQQRADQIRVDTRAELGIVLGESGAKGHAAQKKWVRDKYASKFVNADEAEQWTNSPLFKVQNAAMKVLDSMFGTDNATRYNGRKL